MSANATDTQNAANAQAPSEQPGVPKKITNAQTVCNVKNEKGKLCNGHLKQLHSGGEGAEIHLRGDDILYKCQVCGTLYMGPPLGHVRDPFKQQRFVERELSALLQAAGGTLPTIVKNERGVFVLAEETAHHAPAPAAKPATTQAAATADRKQLADTQASKSAPAAATPAATSSAPLSPSQTSLGPIPGADGPVPGETFEQKLVRLRGVVAEAKRREELFGGGEAAPGAAAKAKPATQTRPTAASTSGTDSSAQADAHRPAAEAQAATGQASAVPLSPSAATASPAAGAETPADLAPDAVTEPKTAAPARRATPGGTLYRAPFDTGPVPGETHEQKIERLTAVVAAAKERAEKEGGAA
ncbi:MAG: hypothetical protein QOC96_3736 [Acidobacteriota bacterium]|jgi:hypothetical protein|nr:hypothetical protein [Acidobacteriota bacterium]